MGVTSVDILYLHAPDLDTPIERTLEGTLIALAGWGVPTVLPVPGADACCRSTACQKLYEAGKFRELGLSNYPAVRATTLVLL